MAKKKKTKEEKILADKRRIIQNESLYSLPLESLTIQEKQPFAPVRQTVVIATSSYKYLAHDLRKTAVFTSIIVTIELILKFLIK